MNKEKEIATPRYGIMSNMKIPYWLVVAMIILDSPFNLARSLFRKREDYTQQNLQHTK